ncbi:hypothetical protein KC573_01400, partial [candidate division WWE3 bacterium]|nr:hypothetical protein [candidate division WWE3 bacterium]
LTDPASRPDVTIASFHHFENQIPEGVDRIDALAHGFMLAIESNAIHKFGHPLDQLTQIREQNPSAFNEIIEAAKTRGIIFEINTGPRMVWQIENTNHQETLRLLIENGNLMDMGSDFHNFSMFKQSGLVAESKTGLLSRDEQTALANWTESKDFDRKFKVEEHELWNVTLQGRHKEVVTVAGETGKLSDILWKVYKGRFPANGEEDFIIQREEIVKQVAAFAPETQQKVSQLLTQLRAQWQQRPQHTHDYALRESIFTKTGFTLGDLKRMYGHARTIRQQLGLPRSQFVNIWPTEQQVQHFQKLYNH